MDDTDSTFDLFEPHYTDVRDLGHCVLAIGSIKVRGRGGGGRPTSRPRRSRNTGTDCSGASGTTGTPRWLWRQRGCPVEPSAEWSIGLTGFEPATSPTRTERATKLRHSPRGLRLAPPGGPLPYWGCVSACRTMLTLGFVLSSLAWMLAGEDDGSRAEPGQPAASRRSPRPSGARRCRRPRGAARAAAAARAASTSPPTSPLRAATAGASSSSATAGSIVDGRTQARHAVPRHLRSGLGARGRERPAFDGLRARLRPLAGASTSTTPTTRASSRSTSSGVRGPTQPRRPRLAPLGDTRAAPALQPQGRPGAGRPRRQPLRRLRRRRRRRRPGRERTEPGPDRSASSSASTHARTAATASRPATRSAVARVRGVRSMPTACATPTASRSTARTGQPDDR